MKKYRFPLHSVATVRRVAEERARAAFSAALDAWARSEATVSQARRRVEELEETLLSGRSVKFQAHEQSQFLASLRAASAEAETARLAAAKAADEVHARREAWIVARRDVKAVENLERKGRERHRADGLRHEQAQLDDRRPVRASAFAPVA